MSFTGHDRLVDTLMPAVREMFPGDEMARRRRIDRALGADGYVRSESLLILGNLLIALVIDDTQYNSASTSVYTDMAAQNIALPEGAWTLYVLTWSRGGHTAGTSIDYRLSVQNAAYNEITRTAPTVSAAPFSTVAVVPNMPGGQEVSIATQFKCDAGATATMNDTVTLTIALRSS